MAQWSKNKVDSSQINNGNEYEIGDNLTREQLNAITNNSFYASDKVSKMENYQRYFRGFGILTSNSIGDWYGSVEYFRTSEKSGILTISMTIPKNSLSGNFTFSTLVNVGNILNLSFKSADRTTGYWQDLLGDTRNTNGTQQNVNTTYEYSPACAISSADDGAISIGRIYYKDNAYMYGAWSMNGMQNRCIIATNIYVEEY